ncbi:hypothetical protein [Halorarius litoreus]|uniref:hypothetical protein n=1 Tax=Halorarius litoreus TaxID=2962676 RepID=UPI0020CBC398|nr:hypothetical protein [Halorarius litoreus]
MPRTRRSFILAAATSTLLATGTAAAGCKDHEPEGCNKFDTDPKFIEKFGGDNAPQPGENANDKRYEWDEDEETWPEAIPKGHRKDDPENGYEAHDKDEDEEKPGERVGHCKFDPHGSSDDPPDKNEDSSNQGPE